jgi:hypothetical protein
MANAKLRPRFISPIQIAQKQADLQPIYRSLEIRQGIVAANPQSPPPDVIDWQEAERFAYGVAGMPARLFLTRAQVQAGQQQQAAMAAGDREPPTPPTSAARPR